MTTQEKLAEAVKSLVNANKNTSYPEDHPVWKARRMAKDVLDEYERSALTVQTVTDDPELITAKEQLWQMVHVQDKQEDVAAFMGNWLRGTIKIPAEVITRIYWSEHGKRNSVTDDRHFDDVAVDNLAIAMKEKLANKRAEGRGGWEDPGQCTDKHLSDLLRDHVEKGDPVDVANFCMMLFNRSANIMAQTVTDDEVRVAVEIVDSWLRIVETKIDTLKGGFTLYAHDAIEIRTLIRAATASKNSDAFDSMNDFRLQEIAVLKSQNAALVKALEESETYIRKHHVTVENVGLLGRIKNALAANKEKENGDG